jgi:cellulose synthase (UDP-forming)
MPFYFDKFEDRKPEPPLPYSPGIELLAQFFITMSLVIGGWYISWRWMHSLNYDALLYSLMLVLAETGAYIGLLLFSFNLWKTRDVPSQSAPRLQADCERSGRGIGDDEAVSVDVFFPTFDEEPELVRLSVQDAKKIRYPHPINICIHVLDDGKRESMAAMAAEEGVNYITRADNVGFKAGNLRHAMELTHGQFILICDADTRPFPTILENCMGYFRDPDVAWVQTPQWFYDIPEGTRLPEWLARYTGRAGRGIGSLIERVAGPITIGADPFVNDPKMFYDVLLRRRNWANAAFCCGAGSLHRREAVMESALRRYAAAVEKTFLERANAIREVTREANTDPALKRKMIQSVAQIEELTPYNFHVSEDIYTSIHLHSDPSRVWKSVQHPTVESKMLSPQDLLTWTLQRFKYAGGTLDIAANDDFLLRRGLSLKQRIMYLATIWSYLGGLWNVVFMLAPIIYLFTAIAPVSAYSADFYIHILPFLVLNEFASMFALWGLAGYKAKSNYLAFFPINLRAIWTVIKGREIKFPVTPKQRQEGNFCHLVLPQAIVIGLTAAGIVYAWSAFMWHNSNHSLAGVLVNTFWGLNNILALSGLVLAAFWKPEEEPVVDQSGNFAQASI